MITLKENSAGHWALRIAGTVLLLAVVWYIPEHSESARVGLFAEAFALIIAAMAVNLVFGYTGLISIGHSAFFLVGGYVTAILVVDHGWSQGWTLYVAPVVAFVIGCLVGLPALRLKGVYLALVTLSLAVLFPQLAKWPKLEWLTHGSQGISGVAYKDIPTWPLIGELKGREGRSEFNYWLAFVVLVLVYLVCRGIVKSRVGRSLVAIRDNETAAAVMGVNLAVTKTLVFGVSAALAALAGSLATIRVGSVVPDESSPYVTLLGSIIFVLVMVIGGTGTLWGPILGGVVYVWLSDVTRSASSGDGGLFSGIIDFFFSWTTQSPATFIFAILLIVLMFVAPYGLLGLLKKLSRRLVVVVPAAVGPSTVDEAAPAVPTPGT